MLWIKYKIFCYQKTGRQSTGGKNILRVIKRGNKAVDRIELNLGILELLKEEVWSAGLKTKTEKTKGPYIYILCEKN